MGFFRKKVSPQKGLVTQMTEEVKAQWTTESPCDPYIYVQSILFKNGLSLAIEQDDIVVFVGPNNAGKSCSLKDVSRLLRDDGYEGTVISEVSLHKGSEQDVVDYVCKNSRQKKRA